MFVCVVLCEPNLSRQLEGDYRSRLVAEMPEHSHIVHLFKAEKRTKKVIYLCRDIMGDERSYALSNADVRVKCLIYLACVMLIFCVTFCARQIREKTHTVNGCLLVYSYSILVMSSITALIIPIKIPLS